MSIAYFPEFYKDELFYSVLARFYVHSGYLYCENAKDALFVNKESSPIIEFPNELKPEIYSLITKNISMEDIILKHTMFPYYARFFTEDKKNMYFNSLMRMENNIAKIRPKNVANQYLRYCPLCVKKEREERGEAIWHRKHQITEITVCSIHGCLLINSSVPMSRDIRIPFRTAEEESIDNHVEYGTLLQCKIAGYISKLLEFPMENNENIAGFFKSKLGTGSRIQMYEDIKEFYKGEEILEKIVCNKDTVQKAINGNKDNVIPICLVAFFLNIPVEEFIGTYEKICTLKKTIRSTKHNIKERNYWKKLDDEMLSRVQNLINTINNDDSVKPKRITGWLIGKRLGLEKFQIYNMPKCKKLISEYTDDIDSYHVKLILWAAKRIQEKGKKLTWAQINVETNITYQYKERCIKKMEEMNDDKMTYIINQIKD